MEQIKGYIIITVGLNDKVKIEKVTVTKTEQDKETEKDIEELRVLIERILTVPF